VLSAYKNHQHINEMNILQLLIIEIVHLFLLGNKRKADKCSKELTSKYQKFEGCELLISWNVRNWAMLNYNISTVDTIYNRHTQDDPVLEEFVEQNFDEIATIISKYDLVYKKEVSDTSTIIDIAELNTFRTNLLSNAFEGNSMAVI